MLLLNRLAYGVVRGKALGVDDDDDVQETVGVDNEEGQHGDLHTTGYHF